MNFFASRLQKRAFFRFDPALGRRIAIRMPEI
jgi:hypothetical protein